MPWVWRPCLVDTALELAGARQCADRTAIAIAGVGFVPPLDLFFAEFPAQQDGAAIDFRRKIDQAHRPVFQFAADVPKLFREFAKLGGERLDPLTRGVERLCAPAALIVLLSQTHQLTVTLDDVLRHATNKDERAIGFA